MDVPALEDLDLIDPPICQLRTSSSCPDYLSSYSVICSFPGLVLQTVEGHAFAMNRAAFAAVSKLAESLSQEPGELG